MKKSFHKNQKGFSHHFLMPVLAVLLVAGIGGYVMLRSSSAATYSRCYNVSFSSSVVHCRWVDSKRVTLLYDMRVQKKTSAYRYFQITPKSSTRTYDNGRTVVTITPFKISMTCWDKNNSESEKTFNTGKSVILRMPIASNECVKNVMFRVTQSDTKDGHVSTVRYTF